MDDAGGGRCGTRATVSAELWEVLAARWAIPGQRGRDLGGSLNLKVLVSRGDERLVVRVHRPSVSPAPAFRFSGTDVSLGAVVAIASGDRRRQAPAG